LVSKLVFLLSGKQQAQMQRQQFLLHQTSLSNFFENLSIACFVLPAILGSLKWLDNLEIISLANFLRLLDMFPVLGGLIAATLAEVQARLVCIGHHFEFSRYYENICQMV